MIKKLAIHEYRVSLWRLLFFAMLTCACATAVLLLIAILAVLTIDVVVTLHEVTLFE